MKSLNLGLSCFIRVGRVGSGRTKGHIYCEVFGFRQPFFEAPTKSRWLIAISQEVFYFPPTKSPDNGSLSARGRQIENMRPGTSLFYLGPIEGGISAFKSGEIIRCTPSPQEALWV
jgi:hypothetical protein